MLLSFSVSNFLSIGETQTLSLVAAKLSGSHSPFELSLPSVGDGALPCAVIYGPNASGKSNMILAMARMFKLVASSHAPNRLDSRLPFSPFLLDTSWEGEPTTFDVVFMVDNVRYDYGFSYNESRIVSEYLDTYPEGRKRKVFDRNSNGVEFGSSLKGSKKILSDMTRDSSLFLSIAAQHNHPELSKIASFLSTHYISTNLTFAERFFSSAVEDRKVDPRSIKFLELIGTGIVGYETKRVGMTSEQRMMFAEISQLMRKHEGGGVSTSLDDDVDPPDLEEVQIRLAHRNDVGDPIYLNIELESLGTRRLLELLNHIFEALDKGHAAIIDELDASLHTFAVSTIIDLFTDSRINKNNAQLIATTHDTNLLNVDQLRRDEIWFVEKSRSGASEYFPLSDFSARKDEALEKQYLDGRYGAIPSKFGTRHFLSRDT